MRHLLSFETEQFGSLGQNFMLSNVMFVPDAKKRSLWCSSSAVAVREHMDQSLNASKNAFVCVGPFALMLHEFLEHVQLLNHNVREKQTAKTVREYTY